MSWEDFRGKTEKIKDVTIGGSYSHFYAIFRIAEKYKTINSIRGFQKHMEREINVFNADKNIKNEILIGDKNVMENVKEYIKECKLRKNSIVARSLLMTASPDFFKGMSKTDLQHWKDDNVKWIKKNFGSNCTYLVCHNDEKTVHLHALIVPKFYNEKKQTHILSNTRYFDGVEKMRSWQDNYSDSIKERFKCLNRGIKYSKQKHQDLKTWYSLVNQQLNTKNYKQVLAKAEDHELQAIKIKAIEKTLQVYKNYNSKNSIEKDNLIIESKELIKEIEKLKGEKQGYKESLSYLSQQYQVPQYVVNECIKEVEQINEKELEK